jgi:hypothetical protein
MQLAENLFFRKFVHGFANADALWYSFFGQIWQNRLVID